MSHSMSCMKERGKFGSLRDLPRLFSLLLIMINVVRTISLLVCQLILVQFYLQQLYRVTPQKCPNLSFSSSSSRSVPKGVGDHVPPQLFVLRLCDKVHCSLFSCPFSDAIKKVFSWSSLRSFPQNLRCCYQVFKSLSFHGVSKNNLLFVL